jgi:hypothetical protein
VNAPAPVRRPHHRARLLPAAAALAAASVLYGLTGCGAGAAQQPPASSSSSPGPPIAASPGPLAPPVAVDTAYKSAVETRVAGSLHLTAAQVRAQLRAVPGSGLESLAKPLGLAEDQLARIILSGLDDAASAAGHTGGWTAGQVHAEKMYWASQSDATLDTGVSSWFANG